MNRDIFLQEPPPEIGHGRFGITPGGCAAGIDTLLRGRQYLQRPGTRQVRVQRPVRADGEPAQLSGNAGLDHIALTSRSPHTQPEACKLSIPIDGIRATAFDGIDGALGDAP